MFELGGAGNHLPLPPDDDVSYDNIPPSGIREVADNFPEQQSSSRLSVSERERKVEEIMARKGTTIVPLVSSPPPPPPASIMSTTSVLRPTTAAQKGALTPGQLKSSTTATPTNRRVVPPPPRATRQPIVK
jgi:hypothetical protein